jgi:putative inorganic carbon (hco3(-)) transporter
MAARALWRASEWTWPLLGGALLATTAVAYPQRLHGSGLVLTPLIVCAAVLALRRLWSLHPAPTLCAALALSVFSGQWREIGLGGLPLDRLLVLVVVAQFLLRAPGVANAPRLRLRNIHLLLGVTVIYVLGSAAAAGTLGTETGLLSLLDQLGAIPFLIFLVAPAVFSGRRERELLLATLVGLGGYLGLTAIFESLGPHFLVFPRYILNVDSAISEEARAGGPFRAVIAMGFATYACAVAAVMASIQWRGRRRYLAAAVAVVSLFGCLLTLERGVWIAAIVASVLTALTVRGGRRRLAPFALIVALATVGALAASPTLAHDVSNRTGDQRTVWDRQNQIAAGLRMLGAKPLFGFGWARYTQDDLGYFRQSNSYPMVGYSHASYETVGQLLPLHETYLAYAVELGLVGALLWLACLLWGVGGAILAPGPADLAPWKLGLFAVAICFATISLVNPYQSAFPVLLLWVWAGIARGSTPRSDLDELGRPCAR